MASVTCSKLAEWRGKKRMMTSRFSAVKTTKVVIMKLFFRMRRKKIMAMTPDKLAPMAVYLASDAAKEVSGQIFAVRQNEIFIFNHKRPIRSVQRSEGWTPQSIAEHGMPALKVSFYKLDRSADIFNWDPV